MTEGGHMFILFVSLFVRSFAIGAFLVCYSLWISVMYVLI